MSAVMSVKCRDFALSFVSQEICSFSSSIHLALHSIIAPLPYVEPLDQLCSPYASHYIFDTVLFESAQPNDFSLCWKY